MKVVILRAEMEDHTKSPIKLTQRQPGKRSKLNFQLSYSIFESGFATKCFSKTMSGMDGI